MRTYALKTMLALGVGVMATLTLPAAASAQSAIVGGLGNFDAANFENKDTHGMEIQLEGIRPMDLYPAWCGNKYGCPAVIAYATGVYVRYQGIYNTATQTWLQTTVQHAANTPFAGTCYMFASTYNQAGCDHFGVHLTASAFGAATTTAYRWLIEDPANPGTLIASANNMFVPTPVYTWIPAPLPTNPPLLQVEIRTPPPPPPPPAAPPQYGDATWMKVFKTEMTREVALSELTSDNAIVPQSAAQIETEWVLMQPAPAIVEGNRRQRNRHVNSGTPAVGTRAVLRRYETYAYTGAYNPLTHEVACGGDTLCSAPLPGELGDMLVAQMAAANVAVPGVAVTVSGLGGVSSSDNVISCGGKCSANYALGAVVTLTAKPASNNQFTGWTGACSGAALTCAVTVNDLMTVTAQFAAIVKTGGGGGTPQFTLSIGKSNSGTVASDIAGINCGNACSAKFNGGTVVTLTAAPPTGKTFVNWSGGCGGTEAVCVLTLNSNLSVQAVFSK